MLVCVQLKLDTEIWRLAPSSKWLLCLLAAFSPGEETAGGRVRSPVSHPPRAGRPLKPAPSAAPPDAPSATLASFHLGSSLTEKKM